MLPKILRGAIKDVYKTPFRMLGNFGKQQLKKLKKKSTALMSLYVIFVYKKSNNKLKILWFFIDILTYSNKKSFPIIKRTIKIISHLVIVSN